jgi:hypothetical protein
MAIKIHRTVAVVLRGCGSWSSLLRETHRLRLFGSRVLGKALGNKMEEVTADWRELHPEELRVNTVRLMLFG